VLHAKHDQREIFGSGALYSFHRIRKAGDSVCKKERKPVRGYDNDTRIDSACSNLVTEMNDVDDQKIASP
jgi:hypothetical protein